MQLLSMAPFLRTRPHVKAESVNLSCIRGLVRKNAWMWRQTYERRAQPGGLEQAGQRDTRIGEIVDIDRAS
jgi:hypothetical protein